MQTLFFEIGILTIGHQVFHSTRAGAFDMPYDSSAIFGGENQQ
jgi:hypothetical protein